MQNSPRNYFQRAFSDQHNVILLIGSVLLSLAFASFLPLLIGFVGEVLFLSICPRLPAFRAWVDARDSAVHKLETERALEGDLSSLTPAYRLRFEAFSRLLDEVVGRLAAQRTFGFDGLAAVRQNFDTLLHSALSLLRTQQTVSAAIAEIPALELAQEVARLDRAFAAERDLELRMGLRQQALLALELGDVHMGVEHGAVAALLGDDAAPAAAWQGHFKRCPRKTHVLLQGR